MNIFIYWNKKDNDSKKIYSFIKQSNWITTLQNNNNVYTEFHYQDFSIDESMIEIIRNCELIVFFTHGEKDCILKFKYLNPESKENFTFIDLDNINILQDKKVIAICCESASILGEEYIRNNPSNFFIGFKDGITYSEGYNNANLKSIMYKAYSKAFYDAFMNAYTNNWTAKTFINALKFYMRKYITEGILNSDNKSLGSVSSHTFFNNTIDSLVCLGKEDLPVY